MDDNLREMGVGDLTVPKRMQAFGEAFYGRTAAYDFALTEGREALAQAMCKNILNGENIEKARLLAAYTAPRPRWPLSTASTRRRWRAVRPGFPCRRPQARSNEQDWDRPRLARQRSPTRGASPLRSRRYRKRACIATSKLIKPSATRWPMSGRSARRASGAGLVRRCARVSGGRFHVAGHVRARIGQTCVVTLEEMETDIDEPIDLTFGHLPEQIPQMAALVDEAGKATIDPRSARADRARSDRSRPVATDALYLAGPSISAKPGAVFEPVVEAADPEDHPFAALKALKGNPKKPGSRKPKGK